MRQRRLVTAVLALVLATLGAVLLARYVRGADERALAGLDTRDVLVVSQPVARGTPRDLLASRVTTRTLPAIAVAPGALTSLDALGTRVPSSDLQPGEQLLDAKFVDPASLEAQDGVAVPAGLQEVALSLERQRMLGSVLLPGARVGVLISMPREGDRPPRTRLVLSDVLVTGFDSADPGAAPEGEESGADAAPGASVVVRLAVNAEDLQKVVFGAEHGRVWLSRQPPNLPAADPPMITDLEVFR